jgi:DNA-binding MarR family transcriptional regulator
MQDPLATLPGYALRRAANAMMVELGGRLASLDMRISDASVLLLVGTARTLTSSDIGRLLDIQRANMAPLLSRMEGAGFIERQPLDRKSQAIVLTAAGRAKLAGVQAVTAEFEQDLMARIPAKHRPHFVPALNSLWQAG